MRVLKTILIIVASMAFLFGVFLAVASIMDYQPPDEIIIYQSDNPELVSHLEKIDMITWNIGYAGLGEDMDFFYDGGKQVRTLSETADNNLKEINSFLKNNDSLEFILLQEVDKKARRSYQVDQFKKLSKSLHEYNGLFALNYNVFFVPIPLHNPMGNVLAGLATFSEFDPFSSVRHSFPGNYSWPTRLFMLDRCFLVNRYPLTNGRQLLIINTHNSAFDDGSLRKQQMAYMKSFLLEEYKKNNYIIVGGDWNQSPFDFSPDFETNEGGEENISVEEGFPAKNWIWVYDKRAATHRGLKTPYDENKSRLTVIDFFLVSPNVMPLRVETIDMDFEFSDHQPVVASFELLPEQVEPIN